MAHIVTKKRNSTNKKLCKPVIMYDALSLIFIVNTLLSWMECTYNNPMNHLYFKYLSFTSFLPHKPLLIITILLILVALGLHFFTPFNHAYFDYFTLFFSVISFTYLISNRFIANNKLVAFNAILALSFFAISLCYYYTKANLLSNKTLIILGVSLIILNVILKLFLQTSISSLIINIIISSFIVLLAYTVQGKLCNYLEDTFSRNLAAIFHLPWLLSDALRTR